MREDTMYCVHSQARVREKEEPKDSRPGKALGSIWGQHLI